MCRLQSTIHMEKKMGESMGRRYGLSQLYFIKNSLLSSVHHQHANQVYFVL